MVVGKPALLVRSYKPGTLESLQDLSIVLHVEPTPAIPLQVSKLMGQQLLDVILRRHLEKFSCFVEMGTELCSFKQCDEGVTTSLVKNGISETFDTKWMIGADGAKSITRDDTWVVTGDIRLTGVGLDRVIAQSEELVFETIALLIPMEITFNKVVWMSDFRANMRTVNKFGEEIASKFLLETYSAERLPVISEMLEVTTSILDRTMMSGDISAGRNHILHMLGINCRFSTIVLDEFVASVKPVNAYGVLDEGNLEAGDRVPDASNMLQVGALEPDATTLFGLHRPWYHTILVFAPNLVDVTPILSALEAYDKIVGYAYLAYIAEVGQTKVFVIRPDGVIGAIVHGVEDIFRYVASTFINHFWPLTLQVQPIPVYLIQCRN
ncbi:hypothetical protein BDR06DRAFT_984961 [Suillus hirtellus]|nr:hypothetical protein BDR06DRAFT_984961 [Suillus hirtellus]